MYMYIVYIYVYTIYTYMYVYTVYIHVHVYASWATWIFSEDVSYKGVFQRLALLLLQLVEGAAFGGGEKVRLQLSGVDQHCIALKPHLLQ